MDIGGYDFTLEVPTTPSTMETVIRWWRSHWPQAFVENVDDEDGSSERFVWKNHEASEVDDPVGEYEMVHVIVEPEAVTLVVDEPEIELAKACLAFLRQEWN